MEAVSASVKFSNLILACLILIEIMIPFSFLPGIINYTDLTCLAFTSFTVLSFISGIIYIVLMVNVHKQNPEFKNTTLISGIIFGITILVGLGPASVILILIALYVFIFPMITTKNRKFMIISIICIIFGGFLLIIPMVLWTLTGWILPFLISFIPVSFLIAGHSAHIFLNWKSYNIWKIGTSGTVKTVMNEAEEDFKEPIIDDYSEVIKEEILSKRGGEKEMSFSYEKDPIKPRELEAPPGFS
jgi:hypothetical protein